jgi:signal transduction histidine kinase
MLDMRTIVVMLVVSSVLMAITLAVGTRMGRAEGFVKWNISLGLLALGWVLLAARGALPDLIGIALADAILVAGLCTSLGGLIEFGNRTAPRMLFIAPGPLMFALLIPLLGNYGAVTLLVSLALATIFAAVAIVSIRLGSSSGPVRWMLALACSASAIMLMTRAIDIWLKPELYSNAFGFTNLHAAAFIVLFVSTIVIPLAFVLMYRERLESEMTKRIAELKALNVRLEEAQTQLLQAEKMAAVGQLAAGIAHEINNPVGFVNSNLGTLKEYVSGLIQLIDAYRLVADACPPEHPALLRVNQLCDEIDINFVREDVLSLLGESSEGLERVKHIVADLKDFSRVGESKWQTADVHKCLDSTLNVVSSEIKYKATVVKEYGVLPEIMCMPFQLNQVFMNLLVNAAHAITERGTITLRTGREAETVWIEVEDSGVGIPAENLERIFEPFFTTKPIGTGTGLGLSVSYGIVRKHQGRIEVRSEPGKSTVFRVILPISPQPLDDAPNR